MARPHQLKAIGYRQGDEETSLPHLWPEGLAHYVENHGVILPMREIMDMSFWLEWSSRRVAAKK